VSTSGTYNYSVTALQVITAMYENLNIIEAGGTPSANDTTLALSRLNQIAKQYQGNADMAPGFHMQSRQRVTMFLAKNQPTYLIGFGATDTNATTQYGRTTISAAEAAGQTTLSITAVTDTTTQPGTTVTMTAADKIGIVQTDGTLQWTTISSTGAGPTVIVNDALTVGAAAGAYVYWYTAKAQRFPVLEYANLRDSNSIDLYMGIYTDVQQYERLPQKASLGDPLNVLCEPLQTNTRITLDYWPQDVTKQLRLTVLYPSMNYDSSANDIEYPQEWFLPLTWELTKQVCVPYGKTWTPEMDGNYKAAMAIARELNPQNSSSYFQPGREGMWQGDNG